MRSTARPTAPSIFEGWRDMNDYMRENKIEAVAPQLGAPPTSTVAKAPGEAAADKPSKPEAKAKAGARDS